MRAAPSAAAPEELKKMEATRESLIRRDDTFLGVCQALGEDFGFNPVYLRVVLAAGVIWNPMAVLGVYVALGVVVMLSRLVFPNPRRAVAKAPAGEPALEHAQPTADNEDEAEMVAVAA